jgi:hypothetical protein
MEGMASRKFLQCKKHWNQIELFLEECRIFHCEYNWLGGVDLVDIEIQSFMTSYSMLYKLQTCRALSSRQTLFFIMCRFFVFVIFASS